MLYVSLHQFPWYPGTGALEESGEGEGRGTTVNVPLPAGTGDGVYLQAMERVVVPALADFRPDPVPAINNVRPRWLTRELSDIDLILTNAKAPMRIAGVQSHIVEQEIAEIALLADERRTAAGVLRRAIARSNSPLDSAVAHIRERAGAVKVCVDRVFAPVKRRPRLAEICAPHKEWFFGVDVHDIWSARVHAENDVPETEIRFRWLPGVVHQGLVHHRPAVAGIRRHEAPEHAERGGVFRLKNSRVHCLRRGGSHRERDPLTDLRPTQEAVRQQLPMLSAVCALVHAIVGRIPCPDQTRVEHQRIGWIDEHVSRQRSGRNSRG